MTRARKRCELVSWQQCLALSRALAVDIQSSGFRADMIVAIGRGGDIPARLLSDYLGIYNLTGFKIEHYRGMEKSSEAVIRYPLCVDAGGLNVLLVDDVSDGGDTLAVAVDHLQEKGPPADIRTATLHHKLQSRSVPDFYAAEIIEWRWLIYPWAVLEDVSGFIHTLQLEEAALATMQSRIAQQFGVTIPDQALLDAQVLARTHALRASQAGG